MSEMVYAVHTRTCTYLLDEEGVCGWVLSPSGDQAEDRCIGAQFVACLDLQEQGGLIGELRVGAAGLFARRENGRFVLLKTSVIEHVDYKRNMEITVTEAFPEMARPEPHAPETQRLPSSAEIPYPAQQAAQAQHAGAYRTAPMAAVPEDPSTGPLPSGYGGAPQPPPIVTRPPAYAAHTPISVEPEAIDLEEVSTFSAEVTLTMPLYRPDADDPPPRWPGGGQAGAYDWPGGGSRRR